MPYSRSCFRKRRVAYFSALSPTPQNWNETAWWNAGPQKLKEPEVSREASVAPADPCSGDPYADLVKGEGEGTIFLHSRGIPPAKWPKLQNIQYCAGGWWSRSQSTSPVSLTRGLYSSPHTVTMPRLFYLLWPMKRERKRCVPPPGGSTSELVRGLSSPAIGESWGLVWRQHMIGW